MIIAVDASRALRPHPTGTELYSARIIEYLAKIDKTNRYILYSPTQPTHFPTLPANWQWKIIPWRRLWSQIRLVLALAYDKPDLLFVPAHVLPLFCRIKSVVVVHDLAFELFPEAYSWFDRWYLRYSVSVAVARAKRIITPSQATKNDLLKLYTADAEKITVIPLGIDKTIKSVPIAEKIKAIQPFFLMVGRLEARKNTARVIEAFGLLRAREPKIMLKLVLIGKPGEGYTFVEAAIMRLPDAIRCDIIELGYIDHATLIQYQAAAVAFIYPSLYEGFGLPLLEAMQAGLPIITSNTGSIPEVVDDAAIIIDPLSTTELVEAMSILATNKLSRQQISKRGRERVKQFSWEKTAAATLKVLKEAA